MERNSCLQYKWSAYNLVIPTKIAKINTLSIIMLIRYVPMSIMYGVCDEHFSLPMIYILYVMMLTMIEWLISDLLTQFNLCIHKD